MSRFHLMLLLVVGLGWAVSTRGQTPKPKSASYENYVGSRITVMEPNRPPSQCIIRKVWKQSDGTYTVQAEDMATREIVTIEKMGAQALARQVSVAKENSSLTDNVTSNTGVELASRTNALRQLPPNRLANNRRPPVRTVPKYSQNTYSQNQPRIQPRNATPPNPYKSNQFTPRSEMNFEKNPAQVLQATKRPEVSKLPPAAKPSFSQRSNFPPVVPPSTDTRNWTARETAAPTMAKSLTQQRQELWKTTTTENSVDRPEDKNEWAAPAVSNPKTGPDSAQERNRAAPSPRFASRTPDALRSPSSRSRYQQKEIHLPKGTVPVEKNSVQASRVAKSEPKEYVPSSNATEQPRYVSRPPTSRADTRKPMETRQSWRDRYLANRTNRAAVKQPSRGRNPAAVKAPTSRFVQPDASQRASTAPRTNHSADAIAERRKKAAEERAARMAQLREKWRKQRSDRLAKLRERRNAGAASDNRNTKNVAPRPQGFATARKGDENSSSQENRPVASKDRNPNTTPKSSGLLDRWRKDKALATHSGPVKKLPDPLAPGAAKPTIRSALTGNTKQPEKDVSSRTDIKKPDPATEVAANSGKVERITKLTDPFVNDSIKQLAAKPTPDAKSSVDQVANVTPPVKSESETKENAGTKKSDDDTSQFAQMVRVREKRAEAAPLASIAASVKGSSESRQETAVEIPQVKKPPVKEDSDSRRAASTVPPRQPRDWIYPRPKGWADRTTPKHPAAPSSGIAESKVEEKPLDPVAVERKESKPETPDRSSNRFAVDRGPEKAPTQASTKFAPKKPFDPLAPEFFPADPEKPEEKQLTAEEATKSATVKSPVGREMRLPPVVKSLDGKEKSRVAQESGLPPRPPRDWIRPRPVIGSRVPTVVTEKSEESDKTVAVQKSNEKAERSDDSSVAEAKPASEENSAEAKVATVVPPVRNPASKWNKRWGREGIEKKSTNAVARSEKMGLSDPLLNPDRYTRAPKPPVRESIGDALAKSSINVQKNSVDKADTPEEDSVKVAVTSPNPPSQPEKDRVKVAKGTDADKAEPVTPVATRARIPQPPLPPGISFRPREDSDEESPVEAESAEKKKDTKVAESDNGSDKTAKGFTTTITTTTKDGSKPVTTSKQELVHDPSKVHSTAGKTGGSSLNIPPEVIRYGGSLTSTTTTETDTTTTTTTTSNTKQKTTTTISIPGPGLKPVPTLEPQASAKDEDAEADKKN